MVGPRGRTAFLLQTAREEIRRRKLLRFLESDAPAWREQNHPEFGGENSAKWVRKLRAEGERRVMSGDAKARSKSGRAKGR